MKSFECILAKRRLSSIKTFDYLFKKNYKKYDNGNPYFKNYEKRFNIKDQVLYKSPAIPDNDRRNSVFLSVFVSEFPCVCVFDIKLSI